MVISKETRDRLTALKEPGDSYEDVIRELLDDRERPAIPVYPHAAVYETKTGKFCGVYPKRRDTHIAIDDPDSAFHYGYQRG